jgi:hypothetical protein
LQSSKSYVSDSDVSLEPELDETEHSDDDGAVLEHDVTSCPGSHLWSVAALAGSFVSPKAVHFVETDDDNIQLCVRSNDNSVSDLGASQQSF